MNKNIVTGVVIVLLVIGLVIYFTQNQYNPSNSQMAGQQPATDSAQTTVEANAVTIKNFAFNPGTLTVKAGTKVTWTNQDAATHHIKSDTFSSNDLNQGDKFEFTFNDKGSFDYHCAIHPSMIGKIVVE